MNKFFRQVLGAILVSIGMLAMAQFARGWPEPRIFSDPDVTSSFNPNPTAPAGEAKPSPDEEDAPSESPVNESETVEVEKPATDEIKKGRPWVAPNYAGQESAVGWSPTAFDVPPEMAARVNFWKDVYTKITTDQGILHDSQLVSVVYDHIDFSHNASRRERKKIVNAKKKEIQARLLRLDKIDTDSQKSGVKPTLDGEDKRLWDLFAEVDEPHKFHHAALDRKRMRFQLGQRDRFIQGIYYSGRYLTEMERVFRAQGLPIELTRLPFVESSFNVKARSRVGASGVWQFMRYTGRRFLRIRYVTDERNDPIRAAEAAAHLFKINYEMLGKWPLAVTGYNHGPVGVQKMIKRYGTDNISDLVDERHGKFGFASANFYACFLAALSVEKEADKYFGKVYWDAPLNAKEIKLTQSVSRKWLLKWFDNNTEAARELNPHLQKAFWLGYGQVGAKDFVRLPAGKFDVAVEDLKTASSGKADRAPSESKEGHDGVDFYVIEQGETLSGIAAQLGVRVNVLKDLNNIDNPRGLHAGQKILVPSK